MVAPTMARTSVKWNLREGDAWNSHLKIFLLRELYDSPITGMFDSLQRPRVPNAEDASIIIGGGKSKGDLSRFNGRYPPMKVSAFSAKWG